MGVVGGPDFVLVIVGNPAMLDDVVCPPCDIVLPEGRRVCTKCGTVVQPPKSRLFFIDWPQSVYAKLVSHVGSFWAGLIAVALFLLLFAIFVALVAFKATVRQGAGP